MPKKILNGIVVSDKPNKTITVMVERKYQHPTLKKVVKVRKKFSAHDENNKFKNGANDIIFICPLLRSSLVTGPKILVPIGSPLSSVKTAALLSNLTFDPSSL